MTLQLSKNTIVVTVAPSSAGKTHWCTQKFIPEATGLFDTIHYISSDDMRRLVLGDQEAHKYDDKMWRVSPQAFDMLYNELEAVTRYPANQDIVLVDSTGLSSDFRKRIESIAKKNHYKVQYIVFDYKNSEDYYKFESNAIIRKHVQKFKREVIKEVKNKYVVKGHDYFDHDIVRQDHESRSLIIPDDESYCVIGDIHNCWQEFKEMLNKTRDFDHILLVGDLNDKGPSKYNEAVLSDILEDPRIKSCVGNHDIFALRYFEDGDISDIPDEILNTYFYDAIHGSPVYRRLLKEVYDQRMYDWIETKDAIITHSPCELKYLTKTDPRSLKEQRNKRHNSQDGKTIEEILEFVDREQESCHKYHIWGHIGMNKVFSNRSNIGIDTGCVTGNALTAVYFKFGKAKFLSVPAKETYAEGDLKSLNFGKNKKREYPSEIARKADRMVENGVRYLSPTMCPADKSEIELESFGAALDYYKKNGIEEVCVQKKHMGSRAQLYLYKNHEYLITRNGFRVRDEIHSELKASIIDIRELETNKNFFENGGELRIIDCELMPWRALGEDLIDRNFKAYGWLAEEFYKEIGAANIQDRLTTDPDIAQEFYKTKKQDFIDKHGHHTYTYYNGLQNLKRDLIDPETAIQDIKKYSAEVEIYGEDAPVELQCFAILADYFGNGRIDLYKDRDNTDVFNEINDNHDCVVLKTNITEQEISSVKGILFSDPKQEGVVVKPQKIYNEGIAPYLKVRNPEYLRIVYGPDYMDEDKLAKLMKRKRIGNKLRASIRQYDKSLQLLAAETDDERRQLICEFLADSEKNQDVDPRF